VDHLEGLVFGKITDRLSTGRERRYSVDGPLADLLTGSVDLMTTNIVPGEPIQVKWRVTLGLAGTDTTSFSIKLFVDNQPVYERSGIPAAEATVSGVTASLVAGSQKYQAATVAITDPNIARNVYRIGKKTLRAEIRGPGAANPEFQGSVRFRVVPEPLDASWWEWRVPAFESVGWKTGYNLVGDFINRSRFASIAQLNAELSEVRSEEDPQINPCDYVPVQMQTRELVAPGGRAGLTFGLLHDWKWLVPVTCPPKFAPPDVLESQHR
jgi:hypothetical protein